MRHVGRGVGKRGTRVGHVAAGMPSSKTSGAGQGGAGRSICWDTFFVLFFLKTLYNT